MKIIMLLIFVQMVTEFFPISSSSHVFLASALLSSFFSFPSFSLPETLDHLLHAQTAFVILLYFWNRWKSFLYAWFLPFLIRKPYRVALRKMSLPILIFAFLCTSCTVGMYLFFKYVGASYLSYYENMLRPLGLCISALALFSLKKYNSEASDSPSYRNALLLGLVQGCALLPGISRLGITYATSRWIGFSARRALHLSFLIHLPLCLGGTLKSLKELYQKQYELTFFDSSFFLFLIGTTLISYAALALVDRMASRNVMWRWSLYFPFPIIATLCFLFSR